MTSRPHGNLELIKRVLGKEYLSLEVRHLTLDEDCISGVSKVSVEVSDNTGATLSIQGEGVGLVDALFGGLIQRYALEYQSLKSIVMSSFSVGARVDTKQRRAGLDAVGEVTLEVANSEGQRFSFSDSSRSIAASSARALIAAVEYFVNSERAFITLWRSRQDAKERGRDDLITRYTAELAEVVRSTSYAEVIETIKKEL